jgi:hypothetical protein
MGIVVVAGDSTKQSFGGGFKPKPEGWYDVQITELRNWQDDAKSKDPAVIVMCKIVAADDAENAAYINGKLSNFMSLGPDKEDSKFSNAGQWRKLLDQAGVNNYQTVQNPNGTEGISFDPDWLLGRFVKVRIVHSEGTDRKTGQKRTYENWGDVAVSRFQPQVSAQQQYVQQPPQQGYAPPAQQPPPAGGYQPPPAQG